jgi:nucleoside-diphosphate-sugar epimerase
MTILFTGHNGFLGKELIPHLSLKYKIVIYDGDLCDAKSLNQFAIKNSVSKIIHSAARVESRIKQNTSKELVENIQMTLNLAQMGLPMVTFCSGKIFGYQESIDYAAETNVGDRYPEDFYGQSKHLIKMLLKDCENVHFLRFFNVFGYHERPERFIRSNISRYVNREVLIVHQPLIYDFYYVEDTLPLIDIFLEDNLPKDLNLVYSEKISLDQVCDLINFLNNYKVDIVIENNYPGKNYYGDGSQLAKMNLPLKGFSHGLETVYKKLIGGQ